MRKILSTLLLSSLVAAAASAQTVDELIEKNLAARGGKDKIKAVQSVRMTGKMSMSTRVEMPFSMEMARPGKVRMDMTLQGMTMVMAYDGQKGWAIVPFTGKKDPEPMPADQLKDMKQRSDMDGVLVDYKEKGHQIELVGKEDLEGTPVYKLKVTQKEGDVSYVYLDAEQYLELKTVSKREMNGQEAETSVMLGDYKPEGGVLYPHSMEMRIKGATGTTPPNMTMTFTKIDINPDLGADRFAQPKPAVQAVPPNPK
jgi:outer membrane lipoprotein-sorting protein